MNETISIVDLNTGWIRDLPANTLTFDVPTDVDRASAVAQLDHRSGSFFSPLHLRVANEEFLIEAPYQEGPSLNAKRFLFSVLEPVAPAGTKA
jgi:hypothetical protein